MPERSMTGGARSSSRSYSSRTSSRPSTQAQQRSQAAREVEARMSNVGAPSGTPALLKPAVVRIAEVVGGAMGDYLRKGIINRIEAGGKPIRENGLVIGVETDGTYFGRQRQADLDKIREGNRGEGGQAGSQAAQMGAAAPQPDQPAAATVRRSALVKQIEAENRRRRLAGMRMLGSRTLLSGGQVGAADTLGA